MYICSNCEREFKAPRILTENHGLDSPPYEKIAVCPDCLSTNFKKAEPRYCRCCGAKLKDPKTDYCGPHCKSNGEKLRMLELKKRNALTDSPIYKLIKEIDEYNTKNNKRLSYGQYVSLYKTQRKQKHNEK